MFKLVIFACFLALASADPQWPGIPQIPGVPKVPQIPGIPGIPQIPGVPKLPQIPDFPNWDDFSSDDGGEQIALSQPVFPEDARARTSSRIVAGFPAQVGQFPHQVRSITQVSATESSVCGGSILSETVVVTAGHCTYRHTTFQLGFGSVEFNNPALTITTSHKIEHELYNPSNLNNDISLLILPQKITFSRNIQPIQLPSYRQRSQTFAGVKATVSGHGKTSDNSQVSTRLMYTHARVIANWQCARYYAPGIIVQSTLCATGWDNNRQSTCNGDSGGPLIAYDNNIRQNILIGVVSFVSGNGCQTGIPFGFVRTTSYLDWIQRNSGLQVRP
ncbi:collagenase-like [Culicoides brevitarsis]|uniref:collagenase-like n=1 Tax=Culicoides brevitarsis TaxID=469753 RepID=UPI00307B228E